MRSYSRMMRPMDTDKDTPLLEEAYARAIACLRENSTPRGFVATTERKANYYALWARDHCITAIAAYLSEDPELIATARAGTLELLKDQLDNGHVPSYIEIESGKVEYGGYGRIVSIDSSMWLAITLGLIYDSSKDVKLLSGRNLERYAAIYTLLRSADMDKCGLIEVPVSGDWADIFDRSYHVLYDEVLYYEALRSLAFLFSEALIHTKLKYGEAKIIRRRIGFIKQRVSLARKRFNHAMWLEAGTMQAVLDEYLVGNPVVIRDYPYYQSHMQPFKHGWAQRVDTFGNALAAASRIAPKGRAKQFIRYVIAEKINTPVPIRALSPAVQPSDLDWNPIYATKEVPHTYHNGGIWPMIAGFWIYALARNGFPKTARKDLVALAQYFERIGWFFPEHIHGETLEPLGNKKQTWSAAGYIIGYHALKKGKTIFRAYRSTHHS
jgi:glycogen debranching enzyme